MDDRPVAYFLCGPSGSGKTTIRNELLKANPTAVVASSDDYLETVGAALGMTYQEAYFKFRTDAEESFRDRINLGIDRWRDVIIDRTCLSAEVRGGYIEMLRDSHRLVALTPEMDMGSAEAREELLRRAGARRDRSGPPIPPASIVAQIEAWQMPSSDEGFELIRPLIGSAIDTASLEAAIREVSADRAEPEYSGPEI